MVLADRVSQQLSQHSFTDRLGMAIELTSWTSVFPTLQQHKSR